MTLLPLAVAGALAGALIAGPWLLRRWGRRELRAVRREFRSRVDRYKRTSAHEIRAALLQDPQVARAVAEHARLMGGSDAQAWLRVGEYAREIVPSFTLLSYYRLGYAVARLLIPVFYRVSVGYEARAELDAMPPEEL